MGIQFEIVDLLLVSPAIALFVASLFPLLIKVFRGNRELNSLATLFYALAGVIGAAILTFAGNGINKTAFQDALVFDGVSTWTTMIVLLVTGFSLMFARENAATKGRQFSETVFLILNSAVGMMTVVWSNDLIVTFVGIELMSLALYALIAMSHETKYAKEAAFKYFVLGSFASAVFLYGVAFIYGAVGSTYLPQITSVAAELVAQTNPPFLIGLIMVILGLAFKVSIFPFHSWTPDVYQGAPTPLTALMSTGVKAVSLAIFLRVVLTEALLADRAETLVNTLQWLAVGTMLVGNIAAIMQNNFKRMLAYSSVAHSGYAMIGLIAAGIGGQSALGAEGVLYYVFAYSIMTVGAFGAICLFEQHEETRVQIDDLKGLAAKSPWVALSITVFMLSLAGIPPTVGFFGKFFIFSAAVNQGLYWLAVWGVLSSVISVYYYLRPVVVMYMHPNEGAASLKGRHLSHLAVFASAVMVLVGGIVVDPFYKYVAETVSKLF